MASYSRADRSASVMSPTGEGYPANGEACSSWGSHWQPWSRRET